MRRQRIFSEGRELAGRMQLRDFWRRQRPKCGAEPPCLGPVDVVEGPPLSTVRVSVEMGAARESSCFSPHQQFGVW